MKKLNLAVVGYGFVGKAVSYGFDVEHVKQFIIDPKVGSSVKDLVGNDIDVTFVCAPTPMGSDGSIDSSVIESIIEDLLELDVPGLIVLKSTVTPDIVDRFSKLTDRFIYNPEFLTEQNYKHDFEYPIMHVFGGDTDSCLKLSQMYRDYSICKQCPEHFVTSSEASFIKYGINSFLATKVIFFNELHNLAEKFGSNYQAIRQAIGTDSRVSPSHMMVPGPDGRFGFGSACFAKDLPAIYNMSKCLGEELKLVKEVVLHNQDIRNSYAERLPREIEQNIKFDLEL